MTTKTTRRREIVRELSDLSRNGWQGARSGDYEALEAELRGLVEWAEEHRRQAKAAGERPAIDANRVARARAALKRAGR